MHQPAAVLHQPQPAPGVLLNPAGRCGAWATWATAPPRCSLRCRCGCSRRGRWPRWTPASWPWSPTPLPPSTSFPVRGGTLIAWAAAQPRFDALCMAADKRRLQHSSATTCCCSVPTGLPYRVPPIRSPASPTPPPQSHQVKTRLMRWRMPRWPPARALSRGSWPTCCGT